MAVVDDEGSCKREAVDWSKLPPELLELIAHQIKFAGDHISFRCVCSSWRSAATERILQPLIAYFTLAAAPSSTTSFHFFNLRGAELVQIHHDHLLTDLPPNKLCLGSSHGYLALIDQLHPHSDLPSSLTLFNPFTKSRIDLPPYFPSQPLYQPESNRDLLKPSYCFRTKVILSADPSQDSRFLVIQLFTHFLALWKEGSWRQIYFPTDIFCCENAFLYRGQLVFTGGDYMFTYSVEHGHYSGAIQTTFRGEHFFVESTGDLLFVHVVWLRNLFTCEVFKVVLGELQLQLVKLENLGDRALFVGHNLGISITASEYPGCNANCIYYFPKQLQPPPEMVRLCLEDGSNECIVGPFPQEFPEMDFVSCMWLKA